MITYERQKLSKIANQWFFLFQRDTEEIIVIYEATVSTNTKKTSKPALLPVFINTVLLLLDVKLLVYGRKRQKPKLICLQYAAQYSTTQVGLLFEIVQISLIWYQIR